MHRWGFAVDDPPALRLGLRIIGQAVRAGRLDSGISQRQLAYRVGLSQSTLSRLETGSLRNMRMVTLARVIGAVNMPAGYLLPGEPPPPSRRLPGQDRTSAPKVK
jgi:transcriptional regulator with XRE-family HTH domain